MMFVLILVTLTLRTGVYVGFRLTSLDKIFTWTQIRPIIFYLVFVTDVLIVCGVLAFIYSSTTLKESTLSSVDSSVFPAEAGQKVRPSIQNGGQVSFVIA